MDEWMSRVLSVCQMCVLNVFNECVMDVNMSVGEW